MPPISLTGPEDSGNVVRSMLAPRNECASTLRGVAVPALVGEGAVRAPGCLAACMPGGERFVRTGDIRPRKRREAGKSAGPTMIRRLCDVLYSPMLTLLATCLLQDPSTSETSTVTVPLRVVADDVGAGVCFKSIE